LEAAAILIVLAIALTKKGAESSVIVANGATVSRIAEAIAFAEGFHVAGSRPRRNNNPGNLTLDIAGGGRTVGRDGAYVVYATAADGWEDLKAQVRMMLANKSRFYNRDMRLIDVARIYTATEQDAWARNVAFKLGVTSETKLSEIH